MGRKGKAVPGPARGGVQKRGHGKSKRRGEYTGEDFQSLVDQLRPLGLFVRKMEMDGNCLFRSFADQILGDCEEHQKFRDECCETMLEQKETFELFHADDDEEESLTFDQYVSRMGHPGRWGSQLELMALCQRYNVNAIVHQNGRPAYEMGSAPPSAQCIQLSYHDGEHYNSIRFAFDLAPGQPVQHLSLEQLRGGESLEKSADVIEVRELLPPDQQVAGTAIRAALARSAGDTSAAAEFLLMEAFCEEMEGSTVKGEGGDAKDGVGSRQSRAHKKATQKQAKDAEKQGKKTAPSAGDADEQLALLGKQLLSV